MSRVAIRDARAADVDPVVSFTGDTWGDRSDDYVPRVFPEWVGSDGDTGRTFVATLDAGTPGSRPDHDELPLVTGDGTGTADAGEPEAVVGCIRGVLLSEWEAWAQGIRVHPAVRGLGVGTKLTDAVLEWARSAGATVCRNMVFSWNVAGLGQSRAAGFDPTTAFRFAHPRPASGSGSATTASASRPDSDAVWAFWQGSDARAHLDGLALDPTEPWACSELTRERLSAAAAEGRLIAVADGGIAGFSVHTRVTEDDSNGDGDADRTAVYGVTAWRDATAAGALYDAIGRDAAGRDATVTRVLVPETVEHVSDTAANRVAVATEPDFVTSADLTDPSVGGE
ncbi:GNAT family N-acetyltransferase [Halorubrum sp. 48-1-W]|uniref:GNAT family N-acetyltransferase n=1 Tax=Halorubrum sp. 48-1-W TaxID=2249761 RepID=UPI000DCCA578|nr:GNAT family N-acetyltransferase [Halorubrum sp. 48-1-W]RAW44987.1 GNAT family N-acetyltransferase [Halorubrum sp. 48-1-W]